MAQKRCLYLSTFGLGDSPPNNAAEVVFETLVLPVIQNDFSDFDVVHYQLERTHGTINEKVLEEVLSADLVIADLTELSLNGFYELGVRHATQLPTVLMAQAGHPLPFDHQEFRFVVYQYGSRDDEMEQRTREALIEVIKDVLQAPPASPGFKIPMPKRSPRETRYELASRIEEAADAIQALRINSASDTVASLRKIASDLETIEDEKTHSAAKEAGEKVLKVLSRIADQLATVKGSRIIVAGIVSLVLGGAGYSGLTIYGLTLAFWQGPEMFAKAIDAMAKRKK
jgi:nucleoside 2-deoxyribosyltransferase